MNDKKLSLGTFDPCSIKANSGRQLQAFAQGCNNNGPVKLENISNEKVIERWKNLGFLDGLSDEDKTVLAAQYERMALSLIYGGDNAEAYVKTLWETVVLPITRRLFTKSDEDRSLLFQLTERDLFGMFCNMIRMCKDIDWDDFIANYDVDVEICGAFCGNEGNSLLDKFQIGWDFQKEAENVIASRLK